MRYSLSLALATTLGLQALRAFLPLFVYVVRDRFLISTPVLGGLGLVFFALSGFAPMIVRWIGPRRALGIAALTLALSRAGLQVWRGDPILGLALASVSVMAFFVGVAAGSLAASDKGGRPVPAFLAGTALDAAIHALVCTRDLHWGDGPATLGALALCAALAVLGVVLTRRPGGRGRREPAADVRLPSVALPLLAWGPYLFLHLEHLGNVARLSAWTGYTSETSGQFLVLGLAAGFAISLRSLWSGLWVRVPAALCGVVLLGAFLSVPSLFPGTASTLAVPLLWAGQIGGAMLLAGAMAPLSDRRRAGPPGTSMALAFGGGAALLLLLLFGHYGGYDVALPFGRAAVQLVAAVLLTLVVLGTGWRRADVAAGPRVRPVRSRTLLPGMAVALLALLPRLQSDGLAIEAIPPLVAPDGADAATSPADARHPDTPGAETRLRVVSFNVHAGFSETGEFAFDRMLARLRDLDADVIALQEISRGWVMNGSADLFELARRGLGGFAVAGPTIERDWGNAVFTRLPPTAARTDPLPPRSLRLARAVTTVTLPIPGPPDDEVPVRVLATHFHHRANDHEIRNQQARFLAEGSRDVRCGILLGDFNALPGAECLTILADAGWRDVCPDPGPDAMTYPSHAPQRRIDTILLRGDVELVATRVGPPWESDHRAVIADVRLEGGRDAQDPAAGTPSGQQNTR